VQAIRCLAMYCIHAETRAESEVKAALNALNRMLDLGARSASRRIK
jgi:hypothetical protein